MASSNLMCGVVGPGTKPVWKSRRYARVSRRFPLSVLPTWNGCDEEAC